MKIILASTSLKILYKFKKTEIKVIEKNIQFPYFSKQISSVSFFEGLKTMKKKIYYLKFF